MEYNLLKTIEPNLGSCVSSSTYPRLTPYPATDFVNPGLGQISRLYSFYVRVHSEKNLHTIAKKVNSVADNLEGSGSDNTELPPKEKEETNEDTSQTECILFL